MLSEFQRPIDENMSSGGFNGEMLEYLRVAGKWGRFVSLVGMAFLGFFIIIMFTMGSAGLAGLFLGSGSSDAALGLGSLGAGIMIFYLLFIAFGFYLYYLLYRFSVDAIKTAENNDQVAATRSFKSLASLFKIIGILTAVYLAFSAITFAAAIFGGVLGSMG